MDVSYQFSKLRKKKRVKLYALSQKTGMPLVELKRIENGSLSPSIYTLDILLKAMNSSFDEMLHSSRRKSELTEPEKRMIDIIIGIDSK